MDCRKSDRGAARAAYAHKKAAINLPTRGLFSLESSAAARLFRPQFQPLEHRPFDWSSKGGEDFRAAPIYTSTLRLDAFWTAVIEPQPHVPHRDEYQSIEHAIKQSFDALEPRAALAQIDKIWEKLEDASSVAESRMRLLLKKMEPPARAIQPEWLRAALDDLRRDGHPVNVPHNTAIESATRLICAVLEVVKPLTPKAKLSPAMFGGVEVNWDTNQTLTWLVWPPRLNWPGVHVRVYARTDEHSRLVANTFHQAFGVIDHSLKHLAA